MPKVIIGFSIGEVKTPAINYLTVKADKPITSTGANFIRVMAMGIAVVKDKDSFSYVSDGCYRYCPNLSDKNASHILYTGGVIEASSVDRTEPGLARILTCSLNEQKIITVKNSTGKRIFRVEHSRQVLIDFYFGTCVNKVDDALLLTSLNQLLNETSRTPYRMAKHQIEY